MVPRVFLAAHLAAISNGVRYETAKRAKGIEANFVILATLNQDIRNNETYIGASRARSNLVIVGPESFAKRFKIAN